MKKTMVFENETAYDNWFDVNEEKEGGHDFLENRVVIIKETRTINGKKFNGFSADSTIECKNVRTAVRRFVKELNSNGFEVSVDDFECSFNGENLHDLTGSGMIVEVEEIDDGRYYVNYMCYQDEVEEEIETEETTEESEATETEPETATDPEVGKFVYDVRIHNDYGWDTYTVRADGLESAVYKALKRVEYECGKEECSSIDVIRIYKEDSNELLKEIISKEREDPETADQGETSESVTKQYECENVVQVAHKVANLTNTLIDRQTWKGYCDEVKRDGSTWIDYTAFDTGGNEFDVSIFLGYDQQCRHYFVSVDYEKCPVPDMSGGA